MIKKTRDSLLQIVSHLTHDELENLRSDYLSGMLSKDIQKKYNLSSFDFSLKRCHYLFPLIETNDNCPACNSLLSLLEKQRADIKAPEGTSLFCNNCGHEETTECQCEHCTKKREEIKKQQIEKKRRFICEQIGFEDFIPIQLSSLSYREKVLLGTLIQAGLDDDFKTLKPFSNCSMQIFPSDDELKTTMRDLKTKNIIVFSPNSSLDCFTPDYENNSFRYNWMDVQFEINIEEIQSDPTVIREFLNPHSWMLDYPKNNPEVWEKIVYWEALSLFKYILDYFHIKYEIGKETEEFFWTVTKQLPLSIVYSIIYSSGKNTAAYSQTNRCPKYVAYNAILQNMRSTRDKIISGQFHRFDYNRPEKNCPQSIVSQYYFNTILKICEKYWTMMPEEFFSLNG